MRTLIGAVIFFIILIFILVYPWYSARKKFEKWKRETLRKELELLRQKLELRLEEEYKKKLDEAKTTLEEEYKKKFEEWKRESLKRELQLAIQELKLKLEEEYRTKINEIKTSIEEEYKRKFEEWKQTELKRIETQIKEVIEKEYNLKFEEWKKRYEEKIREEAISKSLHTIIGKVSEQLAPLLLLFNYNLNPKDMRFLGSPIDYVVFKGLSEDHVHEIIFIEIKYKGTSKLSQRQRSIRDAIRNCKVRWMTIYIEDELRKMGISPSKYSGLRSLDASNT